MGDMIPCKTCGHYHHVCDQQIADLTAELEAAESAALADQIVRQAAKVQIEGLERQLSEIRQRTIEECAEAANVAITSRWADHQISGGKIGLSERDAGITIDKVTAAIRALSTAPSESAAPDDI